MQKKFIINILFLSFLFFIPGVHAYLVDQPAPDFTAQAVTRGKEQALRLYDIPGPIVIVFYPADFTFVCPTELLAFQNNKKKFDTRGVTIIAISTDTIETHKKWLATPIKSGGIKGVSFPIVADPTGEIARAYNVLNPKDSKAFRGLFILDKDHHVQVSNVNNNPLGRNINEVLRLIDAMKEAEDHGTVCPANWNKGDRTIQPTQKGLAEYIKATVK